MHCIALRPSVRPTSYLPRKVPYMRLHSITDRNRLQTSQIYTFMEDRHGEALQGHNIGSMGRWARGGSPLLAECRPWETSTILHAGV